MQFFTKFLLFSVSFMLQFSSPFVAAKRLTGICSSRSFNQAHIAAAHDEEQMAPDNQAAVDSQLADTAQQNERARERELIRQVALYIYIQQQLAPQVQSTVSTIARDTNSRWEQEQQQHA